MSELVTAGKVRHLGVSEVTGPQLRAAQATHPLAAVQLEWSLMWREPETGIVPLARELGVGLVPYSPLGRGLLGGHVDQANSDQSPFRASDPRFQAEALTANVTLVGRLAALAARWQVSVAQLALAWLLGQGEDVVPIPGSRRAGRAVENARAAAIRLGPEQLEEIEAVAPSDSWTGDRASFAAAVTARP
jgi:aryl-alcohol dehydrogenase-like predicted oxidoreductase